MNALVPKLKARRRRRDRRRSSTRASIRSSAITTRAAARSRAICCRSSTGSIRRWTRSSPATPTMPMSATTAGSIRPGRSCSPAAASYGRLVTDIDLTIDPAAGRVIAQAGREHRRPERGLHRLARRDSADRRRPPLRRRARGGGPGRALRQGRRADRGARRRPARRAGPEGGQRAWRVGARQPHRRRPAGGDQGRRPMAAPRSPS